jgi:hypothetical protein
MKTHLAITARIFGGYAAILAFIHGCFEIQQGGAIVESLYIQAIGNDCAADRIWHACFPAITLWPTYDAAGLATMIIAVLFLLFTFLYLQKEWAGWIMIGFAVAIMLCGGGFIPAFTGVMAAIAILMNKSQHPILLKHRTPITLWMILLFIYILYAAGGWLLGRTFNSVMVENNFLLFFLMNIATPGLIISFAKVADKKIEISN